MKKFASPRAQELDLLGETFAENKHPQFMKEFSFHDTWQKADSTNRRSVILAWKNSPNS
jgi:hypothetical protein